MNSLLLLAPAFALLAATPEPENELELSSSTHVPAVPAAAPLNLLAGPSALPQPQQISPRDGMFFELGGGLVTTTDSDGPGEEIDFDEGIGLFVGVGRRYAGDPDGFGFDLMLEAFYTDQDAEQGDVITAVRDVNVAGALVSGIADHALTDNLSVYGGVGVGVSWLDVGTESDAFNDFDSDEGALLTWQARLGTRLRLSDATSAHLGYRFVNIDDNEIDDDIGASSFDLQTEQHVIEVGLRFGPAGH